MLIFHDEVVHGLDRVTLRSFIIFVNISVFEYFKGLHFAHYTVFVRLQSVKFVQFFVELYIVSPRHNDAVNIRRLFNDECVSNHWQSAFRLD